MVVRVGRWWCVLVADSGSRKCFFFENGKFWLIKGYLTFLNFVSFQNSISFIYHAPTTGPGLVFVVMPEAISAMPFAPFWAILFFIFIFFVGVDSQVAVYC